jgi:hypothetical protein
MTITEIDKHDKVFYAFWEKIFDEMPDDVLESTLVMIKEFNSLNQLAKEEHGYRSQGMEL